LRGVRHGYGIRQSVSYDIASVYRPLSPKSQRSDDIRSLTDAVLYRRDRRIESTRGGFVLQADINLPAPPRKRGLLLDRHGRPSLTKTIAWQFRRQGSAPGDSRESSFRSFDGSRRSGSVRSAIVGGSRNTAAFVDDDDDYDAWSFISLADVTKVTTGGLGETYRGEWKEDRRSGYGVCQRSDGLRYEGEWLNNRKHGYGSTTLVDGTRIDGKYKNNVLVMPSASKSTGLLKSAKVGDRVAFAVEEARRAAENASQKVEIAIARS
jgi:junctophilin